MAQTDNEPALLLASYQDLHAGKELLVKRLPRLLDHIEDEELRRVITDDIVRADDQARRLAATGVDVSGPKNLWMAGILDDADRDTRNVQRGRLLDIALIGAVRKAKAAEAVSSETGIGLARRADLPDLLEPLTANREEEIATDRALKGRLEALTAGVE